MKKIIILLKNDIDAYKKQYKMKFTDFWKKHKTKSSILKSMYACSAKMTAICFNVFRSKGPTLIFSNFVKMEGIQILKIYLKFFGYIDFGRKRCAFP